MDMIRHESKNTNLCFLRSGLVWDELDLSSYNLSWLPSVYLTPLKFQIVRNFVNKIMADRVVQKDMKQGKRFRLSTEVRAIQ